MEQTFVLLIVTFAQVQGYFEGKSGVSNVSEENRSFGKYDIKEHDAVYHHYRNGPSRSREPKFISVIENEESTEVRSFFRIPFLSIPVERSVNGGMETMKSLMEVS